VAKVGAAIEAVKKCDTFLAAVRNRDHAQVGWMAIDRRKEECQEALFVKADALSQAPRHIFWEDAQGSFGSRTDRWPDRGRHVPESECGLRSVVKMVAVSNDIQTSGARIGPTHRCG
jgi:hypothetical protein